MILSMLHLGCKVWLRIRILHLVTLIKQQEHWKFPSPTWNQNQLEPPPKTPLGESCFSSFLLKWNFPLQKQRLLTLGSLLK